MAEAKYIGGQRICDLTARERLERQQANVKLVRNIVSEIVAGKTSDFNNTTKKVNITDTETRAYVKIPVEGGRTYSASLQFSGNFSFWAYEEGGEEYGISKINSFTTNYVMTAPANATIMYLCNTGWNADTDIVVMQEETSILGAKKADYPFNTVVKVEIDKLNDLYNTISILGIEKYSHWERGNLLSSSSVTSPSADNAANMLSQRIRTPILRPIALKEGDILSINGAENVTYYVHYNDNGMHNTGWITNDFTAPKDGEYFVVIRHSDNATLSNMAELSDCFTIEHKDGIINNRIKNSANPIPDYYFNNNYLPLKVDEINSASEILNGVTFAFITDLHFSDNAKNSAELLRYIIQNTSVDIVLCSGDFASVIGTAEQLKDEYDETLMFISKVGKEYVYAVRGNHDFYNRTSDNSSSVNYTWAKTYNAIYRNSEYRVTNALVQHGAYCVDNDAQKTRIICLNSSDWNLTADKADEGVPYISVAQANWFMSALTEKVNYKVIVMSHIPSVSALTTDFASQEIVQSILEAFVAKTNFSTEYKSQTISCDFRNTTNQLIFHLSGHTHTDGQSVNNGILSVTTTCDAHYSDDGHGAAVGTITEQAFDIFCVDYDTGTIDAVRVGRGNSRNWTY